MQTALVIILLLAILAGAVFVGHYGWVSDWRRRMPAWGWLMWDSVFSLPFWLAAVLVFYSSRAGFDEPLRPHKKRSIEQPRWTKTIPKRNKRRSSSLFSHEKISPADALECPLWVISGLLWPMSPLRPAEVLSPAKLYSRASGTNKRSLCPIIVHTTEICAAFECSAFEF